MKAKLIILLFVFILTIGSFQSNALAVERYYLKGAGFNSIIANDNNQYDDTGISTVVVSASTTQHTGHGGKVSVRAWSRDSNVKNHYNANWTYAERIDVGLAHPRGAVPNLITLITPRATATTTGLPELHWTVFIGNVFLHALSAQGNALINHHYGNQNRTAEVHFRNVGSVATSLPNSVAYRDAERYVNGTTKSGASARGLGAHFNYQYLPDSGNVELRAMGKAHYVYGKEIAPGRHVVIGARSGNAYVHFEVTPKR